jgi:uncharacterized protein YegJ (DUF2314 family)
MRLLVISAFLIILTASCGQQVSSQDTPPPFTPASVEPRIAEARFTTSFGFLLDAPQPHNPEMIRERLDAALETRFRTSADTADSFVIGSGNFHVASIGGVLVRIDSFDTPYFEDLEEFAAGFTDEELRTRLLRHRAWIAVDVEQREDGPAEAGAYRLAARIAERFADEHALIVFSASAKGMTPWSEDMREVLRGSNPRAVFGELEGEIVGVTADDPEMEAAIAEARKRLPEFRQAFTRKSRGEGPFLVKAPFAYADGVEHMWVEVTSLSEGTMQGTLANEPYYVDSLKQGDAVTVQDTAITDWIYRAARQPVGGFTTAVLARRQQAQQSADTETPEQP